MLNRYNIFECLPDGALLWREGCARLDEVLLKLAKLIEQSKNEFVARDSETKEIVARVNQAGI
jgi:hypothetical protein